MSKRAPLPYARILLMNSRRATNSWLHKDMNAQLFYNNVYVRAFCGRQRRFFLLFFSSAVMNNDSLIINNVDTNEMIVTAKELTGKQLRILEIARKNFIIVGNSKAIGGSEKASSFEYF